MPTREEMRSLTDDIIGSYEDRIVGITQLRATVKMDLKGFQDSRTAMTKELRADLAKGEEGRLGEARALKQELVGGVAERKSAVSAQLKELDATHAAMSREVRADLKKERQALASEAREFMGELGRAVAEGKAAVKALLSEFDDAHATMSKELKADLSKVAPALRESESERKRTSTQEISQRKSGVGTMLRELHEEQAGVRDEWQILSTIMREKRGGTVLKVEPPVEEIAEKEAVEVTPETADIRNQVFEYLANHPDGTRLVELEQEFGVARIKVARLLKNLMDENKVEKQELLYFAI